MLHLGSQDVTFGQSRCVTFGRSRCYICAVKMYVTFRWSRCMLHLGGQDVTFGWSRCYNRYSLYIIF